MKKIKVGKSRINGNGLFATQLLKRGETVGLVRGPLVHFNVRSKKDSLQYPNWFGFGKNQWIKTTGDFVFINHSCDPNVGMQKKRYVTALRNIIPGEELTIDYSTIEGDPLWEMKCSCNARNCRRIVRSIQFLPPKQFKKYLPFVPQYFQNLFYDTLKNMGRLSVR